MKIRVMRGHERGVIAIAMTTSGTLLSCAKDGACLEWGATGGIIRTVSRAAVPLCAMSSCAGWMVSGDQQGFVRATPLDPEGGENSVL